MKDPLEDMGAKKTPLPIREDEARARRNSRAIVMAFLLGGFVVLVFAITIAKMKHGG